MTAKHGFEGGLVAGFVCWLISNGYLVFTPASALLRFEVIFFAIMMFILSVAVGVASYLRGKAVFGTTGDGVIYGFTTAFDIPYIINALIQFYHYGNLPFP